ncbi:MAG: hypothetical protein F2735_07715 [Actinobacteria bacterium]|jgi:hypothetical protein|uniref:Unannotated protein n=1 Tax=freshwater metagenome TaxID=449393 RepID=A0A6J6Z022_9ZZZZ|nr:hypothetical protein [Actinomycetota bacterium]
MPKINTVERIQYAGGLYGLLFGSSKGKLAAKVLDMNSQGWNLHFIHQEQLNLAWLLLKFLILILTLTIWTFGNSELLIFEKDR